MAEQQLVEGVSVIIPAYSDIEINSNSVLSVVKQCLGKTDRPNIDLIIMNDDIEHPHKYDYYLSDSFKTLYMHNLDRVSIRIVDNSKYMNSEYKLYQGGSRIFGMREEAKYDWCILLDDDDMLAPNAVRMYVDILRQEFYKNPTKKISCVGAIFRSFDENCQQNDIGKDQFSIWVQGRLWNRQFLLEKGIDDATLYPNQINRRQGEDYLFVSIFDYLNSKDNSWERIMTHDFIVGYWIPNYNSLSRRDPYYGQHLAGSTMNSSNTIYKYMRDYCSKKGLSPEEDEELKMRLLNMTIYSFFNLYDFIITVMSTDYKPLVEDWELLRDNCKELREQLLYYYDEIQDNDVVRTYEAVLDRSDARIHNTFEGSFFDYMREQPHWLDYDYDTMMTEAHKLHYDGVNVDSSRQVKAWRRRNGK